MNPGQTTALMGISDFAISPFSIYKQQIVAIFLGKLIWCSYFTYSASIEVVLKRSVTRPFLRQPLMPLFLIPENEKRYKIRKQKMNDEKHKSDEELDCLVTVHDGSYMTCDMMEQASSENEKKKEDYHI